MGTGDDVQPPLKVDPDLLGKYGNQLLTSAAGVPDAPQPFVISGADPISMALAEKLPAIEGGILEGLPQLKQDASTTASNIVSAAGRYSSTDSQLAADYERHQFGSAGVGTSGAGGAGTAGGAGSMGQMMGMPMQMAGQAVSAIAAVPQGIMQTAQQISQMTGGLGSTGGRPGDEAEPDSERGAAASDASAERAPEPTLLPADSPGSKPARD